jgi:hypothetical protein
MNYKFVQDSARQTLFTPQTTKRLCVLTHHLLIWMGNEVIAGAKPATGADSGATTGAATEAAAGSAAEW